MKKKLSIIGGNIAGLATAYYLANKNIPSTVYERSIWNKPCGGAISLEFDQYLRDELGIQLADSDHYTERFKVGLWNGRSMEDEGVFRIISRNDLQERLIKRLNEEKNIEIIMKRVSTIDSHLFSKQTIVASGYSGFTKKTLGENWSKDDLAFTFRTDNYNTDGTYPNTNLIVLDHRKMGYGWVFVGKNHHVNIGVGAHASRDYVRKLYSEFLTMVEEKYGYTFSSLSEHPKSWILPLCLNKSKIIISQNIEGVEYIGVGDSLGLAHALSGAGIEPAWQSGWILAHCTNQNGRINTEQYRKILLKNLRLTVWRRFDHLLSFLSRKKIPFKDKIGFFALYVIRFRLISMMKKYPWFALVHDGNKETGFKVKNPVKYL
jgi:flavin-dependent dehydrogenase